jgi:hypothetical protein
MINVGFNIKFFLVVLIAIVFGFVVVVQVYSNSNDVTSQSTDELFSTSFFLENGSSTDVGTNIGDITVTSPTQTHGLFDGNGLINLTGIFDNNIHSDAFSVSLWVDMDAGGASFLTTGFIMGHDWDGAYPRFSLTVPQFASNVDFNWHNGSTGTIFPDAVNLPSTFQHIVATYNGTDLHVYWNTTIDNDNRQATGVLFNGTNPWYTIGLPTKSGASEGYKGSIDEIRVYNRTLTTAEMAEIFNSGRIPNSSLPSNDLELWMSFNENTGTTVYDRSSNAWNGTNVGSSVSYVTSGSTTLTQGVDYTISGSTFTLTSDVYEWQTLTASYGTAIGGTASSRTIIQLAGIMLILAILAIIFIKIRRDFNE